MPIGKVVLCRLEGLRAPEEEITELCFHPEFFKGKNRLVGVTWRKDGATRSEVRTVKIVIGETERLAIPAARQNLAFVPGQNSTSLVAVKDGRLLRFDIEL